MPTLDALSVSHTFLSSLLVVSLYHLIPNQKFFLIFLDTISEFQNRKVGRPHNSWVQSLKSDLKRRGLETKNFEELQEKANNRETWRKEVVYGENHEEDESEETPTEITHPPEVKEIIDRGKIVGELEEIHALLKGAKNHQKETEEIKNRNILEIKATLTTHQILAQLKTLKDKNESNGWNSC